MVNKGLKILKGIKTEGTQESQDYLQDEAVLTLLSLGSWFY
jgi:hypothetical protein